MTRNFTFAAAALAAFAATAPAFANDQLIASAGLTAAEAQGLTLEQIAAAKFNRGLSVQDRQAVVIVPGDAGVSGTELEGKAVALYNGAQSFSDRQAAPGTGGVSVSTRSPVDVERHAQLIASAGLSQDEARGLTLGEIVAAKANRDVSASDRQRVGSIY